MATTELPATETELKERLIERINLIHDVDELRKLFTYIDETDVYELTPEEEKMLDEAERRLDAGLGIPGEEAARMTREFLRELCENLG